ncbi:MAG: gamma-glutamylcyclotransferase family protein [Sphingopyxis sp.]|jgi:gamma-glutamylcyclotransferase (GGCT)/AIG2-like uncharacterized protein YtfP
MDSSEGQMADRKESRDASAGGATEALFAYGTLQYPDVQRAQFERLLTGTADTLTGFRKGGIAIADPEVIRRSGDTHYPVLLPDNAGSQRIEGTLYWITKRELDAADVYEAEDYERQRVTLESGKQAWVYVAAPGLQWSI